MTSYVWYKKEGMSFILTANNEMEILVDFKEPNLKLLTTTIMKKQNALTTTSFALLINQHTLLEKSKKEAKQQGGHHLPLNVFRRERGRAREKCSAFKTHKNSITPPFLTSLERNKSR